VDRGVQLTQTLSGRERFGLTDPPIRVQNLPIQIR
jgi:hypothetical protein